MNYKLSRICITRCRRKCFLCGPVVFSFPSIVWIISCFCIPVYLKQNIYVPNLLYGGVLLTEEVSASLLSAHARNQVLLTGALSNEVHKLLRLAGWRVRVIGSASPCLGFVAIFSPSPPRASAPIAQRHLHVSMTLTQRRAQTSYSLCAVPCLGNCRTTRSPLRGTNPERSDVSRPSPLSLAPYQTEFLLAVSFFAGISGLVTPRESMRSLHTRVRGKQLRCKIKLPSSKRFKQVTNQQASMMPPKLCLHFHPFL